MPEGTFLIDLYIIYKYVWAIHSLNMFFFLWIILINSCSARGIDRHNPMSSLEESTQTIPLSIQGQVCCV